MESMFALDLAHSVLAAELDLALITEPSDNPLLTCVQIATAPLCVAMPVDHPAARHRSVSIKDLGGVGWMIFPRKSHPTIVRADQSSRLVNEFGRAFLKKVLPNAKMSDSSVRCSSGLRTRCERLFRMGITRIRKVIGLFEVGSSMLVSTEVPTW